MKIEFKTLNYQTKVVNDIARLFKGQKLEKSHFYEIGCTENKNTLNISNAKILDNFNEIAKDNKLDEIKELNELSFAISMETGTGKTYVYLKSIYELNKLYGFSKFIIVVPSVAIREGVIKTLNITQNHFMQQYPGLVCKSFVYNSDRLSDIKDFSENNYLSIMIINIDAFNKDENRLNQVVEHYGKVIEIVRKTNPIIILDEPQNMSSQNAKERINSLNPLAIFRFSATHKDKSNLLYKLDANDALEQKLVKKAEALSIEQVHTKNDAYIKVISIDEKLNAKVELDENSKGKTIRKKVSLKLGDCLDEKTNRAIYSGLMVTEIGKDFVDFAKFKLKIGESSINDDLEFLQRAQINATIKTHLEKQEKLLPLGVKVISLFFIDKVANFRGVDAKFKVMFEEEFKNIIKEYPNLEYLYKGSFYDGYFSVDKKGVEKDTAGNTKADIDTYTKIMKDKERLLSLDEPLSFIFSHSALKEGWDNPNVFNICTLNDTKSEIKKHQEIGRGLRIAVKNDGCRLDGDLYEHNLLTVIVNESYEDFVTSFQKEYEQLGYSKINAPKNAKTKKIVKLNNNFTSVEFKELWDKIKQKTRYKLKLKDDFINECIKAIDNLDSLEKTKIVVNKLDINSQNENIKAKEINRFNLEKRYDNLPNFIEIIANNTGITQKTIAVILSKINKNIFENIFKNPQDFCEKVSDKINETKALSLIDGLEYEKIDEFYELSNFESEFVCYADELSKSLKGVYDEVVLDSKIEEEFLQNCENHLQIKLCIKLPSWFKIQTPLGAYNPDWAIAKDDKVYFVVETKGSLNEIDRRASENIKINCGKKHFALLGVEYKAATKTGDIL